MRRSHVPRQGTHARAAPFPDDAQHAMTPDLTGPEAIGREIERILLDIETRGDARTRADAQRLVRLLMSFYGAGLSRIVDLARSDGGGSRALLERFAQDPLIASLLALHDLDATTVNGAPPLIQITRRPRPEPASPPERAGESCELCGTALPAAHAHVLEMGTRRLLCACGTCADTTRSVSSDTSGRTRFRTVPARYLRLPSMMISAAQWDALQVPVDLAFLFLDSDLGRWTASYPGPAGATESLLPLDAWSEVSAANPWIQTIAPDVEAILVRRVREDRACFLVPIDACYELAGRIRTHWSGLGGGDSV